jgi:hypothetical protein
MVNICPVCGFFMRNPPTDFHICDCCGTEFGYDDAGRSHADLRAEWLRDGARWWSPNEMAPAGWDGFAQVAMIGQFPLWGAFSPVVGRQAVISKSLAESLSAGGQNMVGYGTQQSGAGAALSG